MKGSKRMGVVTRKGNRIKGGFGESHRQSQVRDVWGECLSSRLGAGGYNSQEALLPGKGKQSTVWAWYGKKSAKHLQKCSRERLDPLQTLGLGPAAVSCWGLQETGGHLHSHPGNNGICVTFGSQNLHPKQHSSDGSLSEG